MKNLILLFVLPGLLIICLSGNSQSLKFKVFPDGTFDITGTSVKILNCYPAIDDRFIKPVSVKVYSKNNAEIIRYNLLNGTIEISLSYEGNAISLNTSISGAEIKALTFSPVRSGIVEGVNRIFRTPTQIMGGGGIKDWPKDKSDYTNCGFLTGLIPESGSTMVISTRDFSKFTSFTNCQRTSLNSGKKLIDIGISMEKITASKLPVIYLTEDVDAFTAMRNEATEIARTAKALTDKPQSYHWCSWYYAYYYLTDKMLSEFLQGFNTLKSRVPVQTIQIDAGYHPHLGDWLEPSEKFPVGIEKSVKKIIADNYKAGIWIGPYMVGNRSKLYNEHPDWILTRNDGKPIINFRFTGENRLWGAIDEEIYTLDTSNPAVMEYLRQVFRAFRKMGITYFKTDFMLYGAESSANVTRYAPGKTSIEYQQDFFNMIRQEIGPESFWLGCIAPYAPMIGYVDGMRISGDISADWKSGVNMFDESIGCQHINNVWWQNDPDAIILREKYSRMNNTEAESLILWMGMLGGIVNTSDLFHEIPPARLQLFRFIEPGTAKLTSAMPFIDKDGLFAVQVIKYPGRDDWAVLFVNRGELKTNVSYSIRSLTGINSATCFYWSPDSTKSIGIIDNVNIELDPHQSKLLYISASGKSPEGMSLGGAKFILKH